MTDRYLEVSPEAGAAFFSRNITGPVVMLNLLRFCKVADYSDFPGLKHHKNSHGAWLLPTVH